MKSTRAGAMLSVTDRELQVCWAGSVCNVVKGIKSSFS